MARLLCPGLIDLGVYRRPWLSLALLCGTWSALEHSMNDRWIHLGFSYRSPGNEIVSASRETPAFMRRECRQEGPRPLPGEWRRYSKRCRRFGRKEGKADVRSDTHAPYWLGLGVGGKCEQWEGKNVWSSFSCLKHTTEPFWRLTSRRITASKCCTVYLVSMLQEAAAIYCTHTAEVVSDTPPRPSRTQHCNLCALAPNEPDWRGSVVSPRFPQRLFSPNKAINTPRTLEEVTSLPHELPASLDSMIPLLWTFRTFQLSLFRPQVSWKRASFRTSSFLW